jgi:hypothetical protein
MSEIRAPSSSHPPRSRVVGITSVDRPPLRRHAVRFLVCVICLAVLLPLSTNSRFDTHSAEEGVIWLVLARFESDAA